MPFDQTASFARRRESGKPWEFAGLCRISLDSRLRGNDGVGCGVSAWGVGNLEIENA